MFRSCPIGNSVSNNPRNSILSTAPCQRHRASAPPPRGGRGDRTLRCIRPCVPPVVYCGIGSSGLLPPPCRRRPVGGSRLVGTARQPAADSGSVALLPSRFGCRAGGPSFSAAAAQVSSGGRPKLCHRRPQPGAAAVTATVSGVRVDFGCRQHGAAGHFAGVGPSVPQWGTIAVDSIWGPLGTATGLPRCRAPRDAVRSLGLALSGSSVVLGCCGCLAGSGTERAPRCRRGWCARRAWLL